ncbi:MAG: ATP-binding protein, partial [Thermoplasmata archaeon]|nr:ATP-binding protein [Thermoplasmata archaeon]
MDDIKKSIDTLTGTGKNHYLLIGPRKIGKTSIMNKLEEEFSKKGYAVIRINCQSYPEGIYSFWRGFVSHPEIKTIIPLKENVAIGVRKFGRGIKNNVKKVSVTSPGGVGGGITLKEAMGMKSWFHSAYAVMNALSAPNKKMVVLIDEINELVKEDDFPEMLSHLKNSLDECATPFIITGSINLFVLAKNYGIDANELKVFRSITIPPFDRETTMDFLRHKFHECGITSMDGNLLIFLFETSSGIPWELQMIGSHIVERMIDGGQSVLTKEVV